MVTPQPEMNVGKESTPLKWIAITTAAMDAKELAIAAMEARIASLEDHLVSVREQLQTKDDQLQNKDTQIEELHRLLAQSALQAARPWWKIW